MTGGAGMEHEEAAEQGSGGGIDMNDPAIQEAISGAVARAEAVARDREAGLKRKVDELLSELKPFKKLGPLSEIEARLEKQSELEAKSKAADAGVDPDKFNAAVKEAKKQAQAEAERHFQEVISDLQGQLKEATELAASKDQQIHRDFVERAVRDSGIPIRDGGIKYVVGELERLVDRYQPDGSPIAIDRVVVDGAQVPSVESPGGQMTVAEVLRLAARGKGPAAELGLFISSNGKGSGTQIGGTSMSSKGWYQMSAAEQREYIQEHGDPLNSPKTAEFISRSPKPKQDAASN